MKFDKAWNPLPLEVKQAIAKRVLWNYTGIIFFVSIIYPLYYIIRDLILNE